jgi:ABC-type transporter Mla subunit MlaD
MDQELIAYLDERFGKIDERFQRVDDRFEETNQQIATLREETNQQFKKVDARFGQLEQSVQGTRVLLENMHGQLRLVAEGVIGGVEKLDSFRKESVERSEDVLSIIRRLPPYASLDGRVGALESWRKELGQDPIQLIREKFGLGKTP